MARYQALSTKKWSQNLWALSVHIYTIVLAPSNFEKTQPLLLSPVPNLLHQHLSICLSIYQRRLGLYHLRSEEVK